MKTLWIIYGEDFNNLSGLDKASPDVITVHQQEKSSSLNSEVNLLAKTLACLILDHFVPSYFKEVGLTPVQIQSSQRTSCRGTFLV